MEYLYKIISGILFSLTGLAFASKIYLERRILGNKISVAIAIGVWFIPFLQSVTQKSPD